MPQNVNAPRGGYVLAERVKFDPNRAIVEITIGDTEIHGIADGATTNAVIKKLQQELKQTGDSELGRALATARFNVDVVVGMTDRERIAKLVQGRNRSVQVKEWSLANFKGQYDWIKDHIDRVGGPFRGKIGWEENSGKQVSILDLISLLTLFHPVYDDPSERRRKAPTVAFSSKGSNDKRLADEDMGEGFQRLKPVIEDVLRLHDHVYVDFVTTYKKYNEDFHQRSSRPTRRRGIGKEENKAFALPLTGRMTKFRIDKGLMFPLLAAFRALLGYKHDDAFWLVNPEEFFNEYGPDLMATLIEQYELCKSNPATTGKTKAVYTALHNQARLLLSEKLNA